MSGQWGRGPGRKMGQAGERAGRKREDWPSTMEQGGVKFTYSPLTGRVTCSMCEVFGRAGDIAFMLDHAKEHQPMLRVLALLEPLDAAALGAVAAALPAVLADQAAPDELARISEILRQLGPDELAVVEEVAARLQVAGRASYGELKLEADQRDFDREADEELLDGFGYLAMAALQRRRRRQRGGGG